MGTSLEITPSAFIRCCRMRPAGFSRLISTRKHGKGMLLRFWPYAANWMCQRTRAFTLRKRWPRVDLFDQAIPATTARKLGSLRNYPHFLDSASRPLPFKIYPKIEPPPLPRDVPQTGVAALSQQSQNQWFRRGLVRSLACGRGNSRPPAVATSYERKERGISTGLAK